MTPTQIAEDAIRDVLGDINEYLASRSAWKGHTGQEVRIRRTDDRGMLTLQVHNGLLHLWIGSDIASHAFEVEEFRILLDRLERDSVGMITEAETDSTYWKRDRITLGLEGGAAMLTGRGWYGIGVKLEALRRAFTRATTR